jgi:hypothetical protein
MQLLCPTHQTPLTSHGRSLHCEACQANYRVQGTCNECGAELEHLQACGASNWFCTHCNALKSKSVITTELVKEQPDQA